ncbi:MAG: hypothetical protein C0392_07630 [Syntrophus sp. (in: bacteria)]|nr:hypothetical protein [Syntrophus sp. (in: bacteria)]
MKNKRRIMWCVIAILLCGVLFCPTVGKAAPLSLSKHNKQLPQKQEAVNDPLGRSTPQGTVVGFMKSAKQEEYERALQYLDTKKTGHSAQKLVKELLTVLDRGFAGKPALLSNKPEGNQDDCLPSSRERVGTIDTPSGSLDILLELVQRGNDPPVWLFSSETLSKVQEVPHKVAKRSMESYLPNILVDSWFLWFPLWHWILILCVIPISFVAATLVTRLLAPLLSLIMHRIAKVQGDQYVVKLKGPMRILILALTFWSISSVSSSILTGLFWTYVSTTLAVVGVTWLCMRFIDIILKLKERQWAAASSGKLSMIHLVRKLSKVLMVIIGALIICYIAGINITAAVTGLGIGGIAVAFAAQKTLENLFGGIMIISDQPIHVGDFCKAGDYKGTIEKIGIRSTDMRTDERTLVSIPNGQLAQMSLENFSRRDKILFHHIIGLCYETTSAQVMRVLDEIRRLLSEHEKVDSLTARARLVKFADSSMAIDIFAYILESDYGAFLEIQEGILFRIMEIVETSGSRMAFPSQIVYISKEKGHAGN